MSNKIIVSKQDIDETDSNADGPVSSFQSYIAEGDILSKQGDLNKAIEAYSKALTLRPADKNGLVARSKCYLLLGNPNNALQDADQALREDELFFKGVYQKAEALYSMGDFEMALVYFHRGYTLRPEMDDFRLGIQKAREAIDNSIGNPKNYKFKPPVGTKLVVTYPPVKIGQQVSTGAAAPVPTTVWTTSAKQTISNPFNNHSVPKDAHKNEKRTKLLLGELYEDKEYLVNMMTDRDFTTNPNANISELVTDALKFLDSRADFWRQQNPVYARKKGLRMLTAKTIHDRIKTHINEKSKESQEKIKEKAKNNLKELVPDKEKVKKSPMRGYLAPKKNIALPEKVPAQQTKIVKLAFESIKNAVSRHDYEVGLRAAKNLLARLSELRELASRERDRIAADLFHQMANIYLLLSNPSEALLYYRKEYMISKEQRLTDFVSRSLSQIGRIHVKNRKYKDAIIAFEEKLVLVENTLERAWLYHDLGRCYLELKNLDKAMELGVKCCELSDKLSDKRWGMNSRLLIAQAHARKRDYESSIIKYEEAILDSKAINDEAALRAITKTLADVHLLKEAKDAESKLKITSYEKPMNALEGKIITA